MATKRKTTTRKRPARQKVRRTYTSATLEALAAGIAGLCAEVGAVHTLTMDLNVRLQAEKDARVKELEERMTRLAALYTKIHGDYEHMASYLGTLQQAVYARQEARPPTDEQRIAWNLACTAAAPKAPEQNHAATG